MTRLSTKLGVSTRICDSPNVKELLSVASTLRSYGNNTMRERGVDIAILGVDITVLGVDIAILGLDIVTLGVDIAILGVDITIVGVDIAIIGVDRATLRRQEKRGPGSTKSPKGRGAPCYKPRA